ncbi:RNA ligase [Candidatus Kapabacteria bacterium]|nr:RNA ligase [Candidatus Kapabacteria bacterium]
MFTKEILNKYIEEGLVRVQTHPNEDLSIYNYTQKVQFDSLWDEVTLACRGLILDAHNRVIARPFAKFFNLGEKVNQVIPEESFEVFEKLDGSLGILYWVNDEPYISTRGSFDSEQSVIATRVLKSKYSHVIESLDKSITYLFEIIYPDNRIVVDYGGLEDIILIGLVNNKTGDEIDLPEIGFPIVKKHNGLSDINKLKSLEEDNREGFVIKFSSGLRYKIKFSEYLRIHRIVTNVSNISIWEYLRTGQSLDEIIERVPDEFYKWVLETKNELESNYKQIEDKSKADYKVLGTRKETALYFQTCKYPSVLFNMLDDRDYSETIWKMLRPIFSKPFSNMDE